jgi:alpha-beta hydrolase superfamily lysophospholipase
MNDHDWLDEELRNLPDLTAPTNLLPEIMERVQERAAQPIWIRFWREHWTLVRNLSLGLSMALLVLLFWLNPARLFSSVVALSPLFRVTAAILDIAVTILNSARVFQTPLWLVILAVTVASYGACIVAASTVQRLAATES